MKISDDVPIYSCFSGMRTCEEAAKYLGLSKIRVLQFIYKGRLKAIRFGNNYMLYERDLYEFSLIPRKIGRPKYDKTK